MDVMTVYVLHRFHVEVNGHIVPDASWGGLLAKRLFTLLAITPTHRLDCQDIFDELWPSAAPELARKSLYKYVHRIRNALEPAREQRRSSLLQMPRGASYVAINPACTLTVDALQFVRAAHTATQVESIEAYEQALALYEEEVPPEARPLLQERGVPEWASSRFTHILHYYDDLKERVVHIQPTQTSALDQSATANRSHKPHNLPSYPLPFVGRADDLTNVIQLLRQSQSVTIVGPFGVGKTRLATQIGRMLLDEYPGGVWIAELGNLVPGQPIADAAGPLFGLFDLSDEEFVRRLAPRLRARRTLLILDNCEHLSASCAAFVGDLRRSLPELAVLATSQQPLGTQGEVVWKLLPLRIPGAEAPFTEMKRGDALRFFALCAAQRARPGYLITPENVEPVRHLCTLLEGIPLLLQFAASKLKLSSEQGLLDDLAQSSPYFSFPDDPTARLERHETFDTALEWSLQQLGKRERMVLRRLAVFRGGWQLSAARSVCLGGSVSADDIEVALTHLSDRSLIENTTTGQTARQRLLEPIRKRLLAELAEHHELEQAQASHARWCLRFAKQMSNQQTTRIPQHLLPQFDAEQANFRAALQWASEHPDRYSLGLELAGDLARYWQIRGYLREGYRWLSSFLRLAPQGQTPLHARAWAGLAILTHMLGDWRTAYSLCRRALPIALQQQMIDDALWIFNRLIIIFQYKGWLRWTNRAIEAQLKLARQANLVPWIIEALGASSELRKDEGDYDAAERLLHRAMALARTAGDPNTISVIHYYLGLLLSDKNQDEEALAHLLINLRTYRDLDSSPRVLEMLYLSGMALAKLNRLEEARVALEEGRALAQQTENAWGMAEMAELESRIAFGAGRRHDAMLACGEAISRWQGLSFGEGVVHAQLLMARLWLMETETDRAAHYLDQAAEELAKVKKAHLWREWRYVKAALLWQQGDREAAQQTLRQAETERQHQQALICPADRIWYAALVANLTSSAHEHAQNENEQQESWSISGK